MPFLVCPVCYGEGVLKVALHLFSWITLREPTGFSFIFPTLFFACLFVSISHWSYWEAHWKTKDQTYDHITVLRKMSRKTGNDVNIGGKEHLLTCVKVTPLPPFCHNPSGRFKFYPTTSFCQKSISCRLVHVEYSNFTTLPPVLASKSQRSERKVPYLASNVMSSSSWRAASNAACTLGATAGPS